jgi:hypothetical protein
MGYRLLADVLVILHLVFVAFVVAGGLLVFWRRWWAWVHIPAAAWGALIEWMGWICPLTPLENRLRALGDAPTYEGGFIERYLVPILYPPGLTRGIQIALGVFVVAVNVLIYASAWRRWRSRRRPGSIPPTQQAEGAVPGPRRVNRR